MHPAPQWLSTDFQAGGSNRCIFHGTLDSIKEVKATIRTQVLLMFFLPLVTAAIHIAFAFPLIKQIVFAFGLQNVHLFLLCTLGTFGVFALLYTFVYLLTARTYYRIVRMTD